MTQITVFSQSSQVKLQVNEIRLDSKSTTLDSGGLIRMYLHLISLASCNSSELKGASLLDDASSLRSCSWAIFAVSWSSSGVMRECRYSSSSCRLMSELFGSLASSVSGSRMMRERKMPRKRTWWRKSHWMNVNVMLLGQIKYTYKVHVCLLFTDSGHYW